MPTLEFKGKPFVYAHHLSVPFRELVIDAGKSLPGAEGPSLDDNLIIHGDNLEALKALLPKYAGKVDCIFIDPPYNTGNEGWAYNDNVNSPLMKAWLGKTVDGDDLERHDKWACMMWPRLTLLWTLLAEHGVLAVSLNDDEQHRFRLIMDDIAGAAAFLATIVWKTRNTDNRVKSMTSQDHEYVFLFSKGSAVRGRVIDRADFRWIDGDRNDAFVTDPLTGKATKADRPNLHYKILNKETGDTYDPDPSRGWITDEAGFLELLEARRIWWPPDPTKGKPRKKRYLSETSERMPASTFWADTKTQTGADELDRIMGERLFAFPKAAQFMERVIDLCASDDSIILDSFAGSGTTAHAVLAANAKDGGNRKFILIETEDYADTLTAERVRRVASGYPFKGSQKTELLRENVTWTKLKNADALLAKVASFDNLDAHRFDRIEKTVKDGDLIVTGIADCEGSAPGLGGSFTYCELGEPMDMARFFDGATPPAFDQVARYVAYTATGATLDVVADGEDHFVGEAGGYRLHLIYRADASFMRSDDAMLDMATAERIAAAGAGSGKPILVFAAGKYMGQKQLTAMGLTFAQLPYSIHRMLPGDGDGE